MRVIHCHHPYAGREGMPTRAVRHTLTTDFPQSKPPETTTREPDAIQSSNVVTGPTPA